MSARTATTKSTSAARKATRAAVAGTIAVGLLAAGGGTFASWYDSETIEGGTISSGELTLETSERDGTWKDTKGNVVDIASYVVVPGAVLTYTDTVTITAVGNDLHATLRTNLPELAAETASADLLGALDVDLTLNGVANSGGEVTVNGDVTPAVFNAPVPVTVTVAFPADAATAQGTRAQNQAVTLADMEIVLEQTLTGAGAGDDD